MISRYRPVARNLYVFVALVLLAPVVARADWSPSDQGFYRVYQKDRLLGTERITFEQRGDSLVVLAQIQQLLPRPGVPDTLRKNVGVLVSAHDGGLRGYQSIEDVNGDVLSRALSMSDTTYTSYRQSGAGGFGDTYARPPGRIYVVDPQVFVLFDMLCRDMHEQRFDERPITMLYVTAKDTAVDGRVKRLGKESLKVGTQTVLAEKLSITDPWSQFYAWVSPAGRMLRLTLPAVGLRVDRDPASLKPGQTFKPIPPPPIGLPQAFIMPTPKPAPKSAPDSVSTGLPAPRR